MLQGADSCVQGPEPARGSNMHVCKIADVTALEASGISDPITPCFVLYGLILARYPNLISPC